jgi:nucleotide-binding universal stress UspA family protein
MSATSVAEPSGAILKRILVATDFSEAARLAVSRAGQLAREKGAHLHLVHAQPDWNLIAGPVPAGVEQYRAVAEHAEDALREELAYLKATFGVQARGENRKGRASEVLHRAVAEIEPHLIVVGARGELDSPTLAPFLGGTALKQLAYARAPVLIVRKPGTEPYEMAVVAVECPSRTARGLVTWAQSLLNEGDCHVVHAFDAPYVARMRKHGVPEETIHACYEDVRAAAKAFVDAVLDDSGGRGPRLHAHLVRGEAVAAVLAEIDRLHPDLVVVGKHEHPPREHLTSSLGSVALRIAYHAAADVLVVP